MERLTENLSDFAYTYKGKEKSTIEYDKWVFEATNKLGRIEDLEEEIGLSVEEMALILKAIKKWSFFDTFYKEDVGTFERFICNIHELGMEEDFKLIKKHFGKDKSE